MISGGEAAQAQQSLLQQDGKIEERAAATSIRDGRKSTRVSNGERMMSQVCRICSDPRKLEIERSILGGQSKSGIARAFRVPEASVRYHSEFHLSRQLLKSQDMRELAESKTLAEEFNNLIARTKAILDKAEAKELHMVSLRAISELRASFAFMVSTAFLLKQDEREEEAANKRREVNDLKERFTVQELELLQCIYNKKPDEVLVAVKLVPAHTLARPVLMDEPPRSLPRKRRPLSL